MAPPSDAAVSAAELRAVFGKDAFRLIARSRLALPRAEKHYSKLKYKSTVFSFADLGGTCLL